MGILLNELIKMSCFKNSRLAAGKINQDIVVEGITIIEAPDIADWIKGGELLLTSFYSIDKDLEIQKKLVSDLYEKGAAALIIKTSRFLKEIPKEIIELGNELNFPIIEISGDTKYIDIMYPVMGEIFNDQVNRLNYYKKCHERFTKMSLDLKGIPEIANALEELVENPIIIFDNEFIPIAYNDIKYKDIEIIKEDNTSLSDNKSISELKGKFSGESENIYNIVCEPIDVLNHTRAYLCILELNSSVKELDLIALESAASTLRLEMVKKVAVNQVEIKYKWDLMDDLINGKYDSIQEIYDRSQIFGWNLNRKFVTIVLNISQYEDYIKNKEGPTEFHLLREKINKIMDKISYYYTSDYIYINKGDNIIILWPLDGNYNLKDSYSNIKRFGNEIKMSLQEEKINIVVSIGIGGVAINPAEIKDSYSQAKDAISLGKKILGNDFITTFEELGVYKLLLSYDNKEELKKFIHPSLLKLKDYDRGKNHELLDTLQVYMSCNLNAVKTAEELFVHYKTVVYRLNKIKQIIELDIENRDTMLEIEIGLKILRILNL